MITSIAIKYDGVNFGYLVEFGVHESCGCHGFDTAELALRKAMETVETTELSTWKSLLECREIPEVQELDGDPDPGSIKLINPRTFCRDCKHNYGIFCYSYAANGGLQYMQPHNKEPKGGWGLCKDLNKGNCKDFEPKESQ